MGNHFARDVFVVLVSKLLRPQKSTLASHFQPFLRAQPTYSGLPLDQPQLIELKKIFASRMLEDPPQRHQTSIKTRVAIMNRCQKIVFVTLVLAPFCVQAESAKSPAAPLAQTVIYKHVDEQGRVTYANSPIKGGARVELEPLTVIPATPGGSLNPSPSRGLAGAPTITPIPVSAPIAHAAIPAVVTAPGITTVTPKAVPAEIKIASLDTNIASQQSQQRRAEVKKRILEGEVQSEEQMLAAAKTALEEEQKNTGQVRAMRASFSTSAATATPQKPLVAPEIRAEIERHFERVRNLQDQLAMHENTLQGLREQMAALK